MFASSSTRSNVLALILAAACWGIGTVVSKRAIDEIPPLTLLPIQLAVSLAALALLMRWRGQPFRDPLASPILGRLGVLNPGLAYALSLLGLVSITASLSVMIWAIEPLVIVLLAAWFLRERVGPSFVILSLVAVGGLVLVIGQPGGTGSLLGVLLTLAGVACCATYTVVTRRWLVTAYSTTQVIVVQQVYAIAFALVLVTAVWLLGGAPWPEGVTAAGWASAIASGILYYGLAYWFYLSGLRHVPASLAAVSFYLIPIFGVAGAWLLLGERLEPAQWIGVAIVLSAVLLITRRSSASGSLATERRPIAEGPVAARSDA
jgi:probable blue pigment (indigoidine) exporter